MWLKEEVEQIQLRHEGGGSWLLLGDHVEACAVDSTFQLRVGIGGL
jgi:hypothetical protein